MFAAGSFSEEPFGFQYGLGPIAAVASLSSNFTQASDAVFIGSGVSEMIGTATAVNAGVGILVELLRYHPTLLSLPPHWACSAEYPRSRQTSLKRQQALAYNTVCPTSRLPSHNQCRDLLYCLVYLTRHPLLHKRRLRLVFCLAHPLKI